MSERPLVQGPLVQGLLVHGLLVQGLLVQGLRDAYASPRTGLRVADVVEEVLARLSTHDDDAVWVERVPEPALRARAAQLDAGFAADPDVFDRLPLFGVPFAVKANIDVAGLATTAACPAFAYHPDDDATAVRRLLEAGAVLVGTTNLDQFATGLVGVRSPYGTPRNPAYPDLVPGGSSSGSACAVSAGIVAFSLGTDTAGSGRVPAALQGLVGLKPTRGLVSTSGVVPACRSLDCVSVFAHTAADAALVLDVLRGPDPADPFSRTPPAGDAAAVRRPSLARTWLGMPPPEELEFFGDDAVRRAYLAAAQAVAARSAGVVDVPLGPLHAAGDLLYRGPWVAERLAVLGDFIAKHPDDVLPVTRGIIEGGASFSAADAFRGQYTLAAIAAGVRTWWDGVDALLLPTVGTTFTPAQVAAEPLARNADLGHYTQFANLLDLAAVAVPAGVTDDGRPVSLMLLGPAFSDDRLLALAAEILREGEGATTVAVAGKHLTGEGRNHELVALGARYEATVTTAPCYRLLALPPAGDPLPALVRASGQDGGAAIEVELWAVPRSGMAGLVAAVPPGLALGHLELEDGRDVIGFVGDAYAVADPGAVDLTSTGGWRYRPRRTATSIDPDPLT